MTLKKNVQDMPPAQHHAASIAMPCELRMTKPRHHAHTPFIKLSAMPMPSAKLAVMASFAWAKNGSAVLLHRLTNHLLGKHFLSCRQWVNFNLEIVDNELLPLHGILAHVVLKYLFYMLIVVK